MQAATSCLLLGGPQFMQQQGVVLSGMLTSLIGHVNDRGMLLLLPLMSLVLQLAPQGAQQLHMTHAYKSGQFCGCCVMLAARPVPSSCTTDPDPDPRTRPDTWLLAAVAPVSSIEAALS